MLTKDPYLSENDFRFIVQDIGPQLINYFPVQERLAGLAAEERLAGLAAEERLAGLAAEEIEAYLKRLKAQSSSNSKSANK